MKNSQFSFLFYFIIFAKFFSSFAHKKGQISKSICKSNPHITVDVFLFLDNNFCYSDIDIQQDFIYKMEKNTKFSNIHFNYFYFDYQQNSQKKTIHNPDFSNKNYIYELCYEAKKQNKSELFYYQIPKTPVYGSVQMYFFFYTSQKQYGLETILKRKVIPIYLDISQEIHDTIISEELGYIDYAVSRIYDQPDEFEKMFCSLKSTCHLPKLTTNSSILIQNLSKIKEVHFKDEFQYVCVNKSHTYLNTSLKVSDLSNHTYRTICSFTGTYTLHGKTIDCKEILCERPIIANNVNLKFIENLRGDNYSQAKNASHFKYLAIILLSCKQGYQFEHVKRNQTQLTCMENEKQFDILHKHIHKIDWKCTEPNCDSIKSIINGTITRREKTKIQGKCNSGFVQNKTDILFYTCEDKGINNLYKCYEIIKTHKRSIWWVILIVLLSSIAFIAAIGITLFYCFTRRKQRDFMLLQKTEDE